MCTIPYSVGASLVQYSVGLVLVIMKVSVLPLCLLLVPTITCYHSRTALNTNAIYEGVMQPDNIVVGIIQNFYNFLTSTVGWLLVIPFYQVS